MTAETTVIDALAVFRLARLVTEDTLPPIRKARTWIWEHFPPIGSTVHHDDGWRFDPPVQPKIARRVQRVFGRAIRTEVKVNASEAIGEAEHAVVMEAHPLGELVGCPWCVSWYLAAMVVCARRFAPEFWNPIARALAFSAVAGVIASRT